MFDLLEFSEYWMKKIVEMVTFRALDEPIRILLELKTWNDFHSVNQIFLVNFEVANSQ